MTKHISMKTCLLVESLNILWIHIGFSSFGRGFLSSSEETHTETPFFTLQMNIQAIGISKKMSKALEVIFFSFHYDVNQNFETQNIITERCYPLAIFNFSAIETQQSGWFSQCNLCSEGPADSSSNVTTLFSCS